MPKINSVLLIDDDQINNFINKRIINNLQLTETITIAHNGEDALKKIKEFELKNGDCPELLFLDINMPVMNGFEFLDKFQTLNFKNKHSVRIIVITTSTNPMDLLKLKEYNIAGILNKPLTEQKILEILEEQKIEQ